MTAEIVVLNRTAVALAADSATTLVSRRGAKATNNADKLFHLCDTEPVGLMVFGNAEFMDMPLEPIVKGFRSCRLASAQETLQGYAEAFFSFLEEETYADDRVTSAHVRRLLNAFMNPMYAKVFEDLFSSQRRLEGQVPDLLASDLIRRLDEETERLSSLEDCDSLAMVPIEQIVSMYDEAVREEIRDRTKPAPPAPELQDALESSAVRFLGVVVKKKIYSDLNTGFVFAGYGSKDNLPSLYVYECDGIVAGRVKRDLSRCIQVDPLDTKGHVEALAQSDVVKRYTEGIDPRLNSLLADKLGAAIKGFGSELADTWLGKKGKRRTAAGEQIEAAAHEVAESFLKEVVEKAREEERQDIIDVVHFMSKSELAQLAEALVEMTALRRRVSMEVETVGGPIDVAVISKGDGFVWIKRKHYFNADLNPRYFVGQRIALEQRRSSNGDASNQKA